MITASYDFLPHIRVSVVIIFKSVGYNWVIFCAMEEWGSKPLVAKSFAKVVGHSCRKR
ncbi:hypothetical protein [Symbiopectobacterium sp. RP]|uniref:hypothetical protein n=1 Tax=Symbiopectobacterium sp. RP TaxID=3248553 RepID=UPI003D2C0474